MNPTLISFAEAIFLVAVVAVLMWLMYRDVWQISVAYPERRVGTVVDCGLYLLVSKSGTNFTRIGVSADALVLKTVIIPKFLYISASVPWQDVWAREQDTFIWLSFTNVEDIEVRFNRVLVTTMQRRLRREVPFGHVI